MEEIKESAKNNSDSSTNTESSENLYDSLTKAFESTLSVIKYAVYPATFILHDFRPFVNYFDLN